MRVHPSYTRPPGTAIGPRMAVATTSTSSDTGDSHQPHTSCTTTIVVSSPVGFLRSSFCSSLQTFCAASSSCRRCGRSSCSKGRRRDRPSRPRCNGRRARPHTQRSRAPARGPGPLSFHGKSPRVRDGISAPQTRPSLIWPPSLRMRFCSRGSVARWLRHLNERRRRPSARTRSARQSPAEAMRSRRPRSRPTHAHEPLLSSGCAS